MPKYDLIFLPPVMNAAGSLGFSPKPHLPMMQDELGAFVTNPVSLGRRTPANQRLCLEFSGGFLLHSGHPNPGLSGVLQRYAASWRGARIPVIVHLLVQSAHEVREMVRRLEQRGGVSAIELGLASDCTPTTALELIQAAQGELPVILRLPLEIAIMLGEALQEAPVYAFSLGAPRGALQQAEGELVHGRLYGPSLFPLALAVTERLGKGVVPVIGAGGIYQPDQIQTMLAAGAIAVQLDAVLWRLGW
jgi:dihydroorotate dehydrogenase (NAD+) catalytic subunit